MSVYAMKAEMPAEDWNNFEDGETQAMPEPAKAPISCDCRPEIPELDNTILERVRQHVHHARQKHPDWTKSRDFVRSVAGMEFHEFEHALTWEGRLRAEEEALDLIAVLWRFLERDDD